MLFHHLKVARRNLWKYKALTLINTIGLSVGMGCLFLTAAYFWRELNVNAVIPDNERVLVLRSKWQQPGMGLEFTTLAPIAKALYENYPTLVENYYHHDGINSIVSRGDRHFSESLQPGDTTFLELFGFELLHGEAQGALEEPFAVVITAAKAQKYFGRTDVVGETLRIQSFSGEEGEFTVKGVLKDLPYNTITNYNNGANEIFLSAAGLGFFGRAQTFESWQNPYLISYVKLREGIAPESLREPLADLVRSNTPAAIHSNLEIYTTAVKYDYLQLNNGSAKRMMYTIGCIALFILLMAVVNFVNTTLSNSLSRLKETGVRKVLGGKRQQLITQYLVEAMLFAVLSAMMGLVIYALCRPAFSEIMGKTIPSLLTFPWFFYFFPLLAAVLIGGLAGTYPAVVAAAQPSVAAMKGKLKTVKEQKNLQAALLVLQFTTALVVFIGAVVVHQQVSFFFSTDLGYNKESIIVLRTPRDWTASGVQQMRTARDEFARLPEVVEATFSFEIPDGQSAGISNKLYRAARDPSTAVTSTSLMTDEYYATTYGMQMVAGDFFDAGDGSADNPVMILNETAAEALGWVNAAAAVGQQLKLEGVEDRFTVKGVMKDFHFNTMHETIRPIFFQHVAYAQLFRYFSFKVKPGNLATTIAALQDKWTALFPASPFDFSFMDETLAGRYQNELQLKKASQAATVVALLIVLLGVLGIVLLAITRRTKEVGIRTVLGASVAQIIWLFGKAFFGVLLLAVLFAWPLAWWLLSKWLALYAYQVSLSALSFAGTALVLVLLTVLMVFMLVYLKAFTNPVESLRSE